MIVPDVNVLLAMHREDAVHHARVAGWFRGISVSEPIGLAPLALVGLLRIATHPTVFQPASTAAQAFAFSSWLLGQPATRQLDPGPAHWVFVSRLVTQLSLRGNDIPDAHLVALCLEHSATLATFDKGFARFDGLSVVEPGA